MREVIDYTTGQFTDYKGLVHKVVLATISKSAKRLDGNKNLEFEVDIYEKDERTDYYCDLAKTLSIGVAICNPIDTFNEEVGREIAIARARTAKPIMFVTKSGIINTKMVQALMEQELEYICNNPGLVIKGYKEAEEEYNKGLEYEKKVNNMDTNQKTVFEFFKSAPDAVIKEIQKIASYFNNKKQ